MRPARKPHFFGLSKIQFLELREGSPGIDRPIKAMINFELHGLMNRNATPIRA